MAERVLPLRAPAGQVLFRPGQECPGYIRLRRGTVKVTLTAPSGREVVLYRVGPGDVCLQTFACLTEGKSYSAEGVAESEVEGEIVPHAAFLRLMAEDGGFRQDVLRAVAARFAEYERLVEDVALTGFDARLARVLLRLASPAGEVRATHEELAAETASGRAFVSRRLGALARAGALQTLRGRIRILDRAGLETIAAGKS